jgi:metallophosphoesterase superfamily enzyme
MTEQSESKAKELLELLKWIMPKVHQGNHEGDIETCEKATCVQYRKALEKYGDLN